MLSPIARQILFFTPWLRELTELDREAVTELFEEVTVAQGDVIFREGEPTVDAWVIVTGAVDLSLGGEPITRMPPGETIGIATEDGQPRLATATAALDCRLLRMGSECFERFAQLQPRHLEEVAASMGRALRIVTGKEAATRCEFALVASRKPWGARRSTVLSLAEALEDELEAPIAIVTAVKAGGEVPAPARRNGLDAVLPIDPNAPAAARERLTSILGGLTGKVPYVLCERDDSLQSIDLNLGLEPDLLIERITGGDLPARPMRAAKQVLYLHDRLDGAGPPLSGGHIAMLPAQRSRRRRAFERIARQVCGRSVGIALGSGAGWGLAHIGVLEVLDEAGIPVDYVAGASMGAIVGGHYALGIPPEEMRQFVSRVEKPSDFLGMLPDLLYLAMDFNVTRPGLFAGERFKELIASIAPIAGKTFADLEIPFRAIATDIDTGARAEICDGEVSEAVHASFAAPFILSPHRIGDGVYIDGGMVDPVPAEPVRHMGADLVIAVNVVPPLKKNVENPIRRAVSGSVGRLNPLRRPEKQLPGSFDVIARTLQLMQHQLGNDRAGEADVLIIPALEDFWVLEFWSGGPMIEKGAEAARAALPDIRERLESMRKTAPRASAEQAS